MKFKLNHIKKAAIRWYENDPFSQSAAIAYYTIFSFPALVLIYLTIASLFSNRDDLQAQISLYLKHIVGESGVENIKSIIDNTAPDYTNPTAAIIGGGIILFAGLRLFMQLQKTLNMIWEVKVAKHVKIMDLVKQRLASLGVMLAIGFILLTSLILTTFLAFVDNWISNHVSQELLALFQTVNFIFSLLTISMMFTILLKLLPDVKIPWKYAFVGGGVTALMFLAGEYFMGLYFEIAEPQSAYGVAGSIILLMLWVSYSCVILLFGAELTKVVYENNRLKPAAATDIGAKKIRTKKEKAES